MMRALRLLPFLAGALALALAAPRPAAAQANSCLLQYQNGPWQIVGAPESRVIAADGPLLVTCNGGEELRADSAVIYQLSNEVHLFGNVDFQDPTRSLTADRATYTSTTGRLYATGNVVFTDKQRGSTLRGPELEYFRVMEGRPQSQAIATQRPHLTVVPKNEGDAGGERREPMEVDADRITTVGDKYMTAEGTVVIQGKDLDASAAEAYYDSDTERMELRRQARVKGEKYELTGEFIESDLADGRLEKVLARTNARLVSERMTMTGPQLQLFFADDLLQRLVSGRAQVAGQDSAAAAGRSVALAKGFRMEADSLEALMPGQRLKEVHAIGRAQGEAWDTAAVRTVGVVDTAGGPAALAPAAAGGDTVPPTALGERDQLMADTIIGYFRPDTAAADSLARDSAAADTARRPAPAQRDTAGPEDQDAELERMVAIGNARSLYRLKDDDEPDRKPGINYVTGEKIDLTFADGEVDVAKVTGLQRGVYLDPDAPQQAQPPAEGAPPAAGQPAGRPGQPNQPAGAPPRQMARPQPPAPTPGGRP